MLSYIMNKCLKCSKCSKCKEWEIEYKKMRLNYLKEKKNKDGTNKTSPRYNKNSK